MCIAQTAAEEGFWAAPSLSDGKQTNPTASKRGAPAYCLHFSACFFDYFHRTYSMESSNEPLRGSVGPACAARGASVRETAGRLVPIESTERPPSGEPLGYASKIVFWTFVFSGLSSYRSILIVGQNTARVGRTRRTVHQLSLIHI